MKRAVIGLFVLGILISAFGTTGAVDYYGAIAYSRSTGKCGVAYNYRSKSQAEEAAVRNCNCTNSVVFSWENSCGALAVGDNGAEGWNYDYDRVQAWGLALIACRQKGSNCKIACEACTSRDCHGTGISVSCTSTGQECCSRRIWKLREDQCYCE